MSVSLGYQQEIRKGISELILESLRAGKPPWRSVRNRGIPTNARTGIKYTGINPLILDAVADKRGYSTKFWATYKQWGNLRMQVSKKPESFEGDYGTKIANWKPVEKLVNKNGVLEKETFKLLETHVVFNFAQCFSDSPIYLNSSSAFDQINETEKPKLDYSKAEKIVESTKAEIFENDSVEKPVYDRKSDKILFPSRRIFVNDAQYWATKFHEIFHWAESRTGWSGSPHQGELIAEIATGYLESELGFPHDTDTANHDKFMDKWIEEIEENPNYLFEAAAQASRSLDCVLAFSSSN